MLLPIAMGRTADDWANINTLTQFGSGVIGNTLGGSAWLLLGWSYWRQRPGFAACSAALGAMYLLGGTMEHAFIPSTVSLIGVTFYLFVQLLVWNPWAAHVARTATRLAPAPTTEAARPGVAMHADASDV